MFILSHPGPEAAEAGSKDARLETPACGAGWSACSGAGVTIGLGAPEAKDATHHAQQFPARYRHNTRLPLRRGPHCRAGCRAGHEGRGLAAHGP
jgi:hypothetical protein